MPLENFQIKYLRSAAHHLKPVLVIGKNGITDGTLHALNQALSDHELVKIKFSEFKDQKNDMMIEINEKTSSELIQIVGHTATLYKENPDPEKKQITLPSK